MDNASRVANSLEKLCQLFDGVFGGFSFLVLHGALLFFLVSTPLLLKRIAVALEEKNKPKKHTL